MATAGRSSCDWALAHCGDGYRFAKRQGKPISQILKNPHEMATSRIPPMRRGKRVYAPFIPMLKLSFKFERA
jgi:hypothetical protein